MLPAAQAATNHLLGTNCHLTPRRRLLERRVKKLPHKQGMVASRSDRVYPVRWANEKARSTTWPTGLVSTVRLATGKLYLPFGLRYGFTQRLTPILQV